MYYSMGLSWGDYRQSFKRIHRANQTKTVHYTYLALADTIDERVVRLIENRGDIVQALLDEYSQEG
jgi:SNF2 family DNA or RNA helicase